MARKKFECCKLPIIIRYALLQLPSLALIVVILLALESWLDLPIWWKTAGILLWVGKDILLYPLTWRAYVSNDSIKTGGWKGKRGTVRHIEDGRITVEAGGELWHAREERPGPPLIVGEEVEIIQREGMTLIISRKTTNQ